MEPISDPSVIDLSLESRAISFESPTGAKGAGGTAHGGRKGAPRRRVGAGESVVLADIDGPGAVRHIWMTVPPMPPEQLRGIVLEAWYDGGAEPSVAVPLADFFGLAHGRPVAYASAVHAVNEARGFNSWLPMPFGAHLRMALTNGSGRPIELYYQLDLTLGGTAASYLHVSFRRENPTTMGDDFVIAAGLAGPGRFAGCAIGVRVLDEGMWYGEGEVKMYVDGDRELPTICGTGLEDYVGSAWGMGAHAAPYGGAPLVIGRPDFVSFYRWHLPDPVVFRSELRVTIQQIGFALFGDEATFDAYAAAHPAAGEGWAMRPRPNVHAIGIAERVDDYSAAAFVYCTTPQAVPPVDVAAATADLTRLAGETPDPMERFLMSP